MEPFSSAMRIAAPVICFLLLTADPASAQCDCACPQPCTITTNIADFVGAPDRTMCTVRTTAGYGSGAYTLTTPRGGQYRIGNPITMFHGWVINRNPGAPVAPTRPPHPSYPTPNGP